MRLRTRLILGALSLFLIAVGLWLKTYTPFPSETARSMDEIAVENLIDWSKLTPGDDIFNGSFIVFGGTSSLNMHTPRDLVVFLPSAGREASDFIELSRTVEAAGHSVDMVDFPSLKRRNDPKDLEEYARIFNPIILAGDERVVLIGHAYGNRVARKIARQNPDRISAVILLAAGGQVPPDPETDAALKRVFNPLKSHKSRMADVRTAFFAEGNEIPDYWTRGWHRKTAIAQGKAKGDEDDSWHCAGGVPMLIIQPMQDKIAPPENAYALKDKCPQEVEIVEVQNAGHALLPEQPEAVAEAALAFLAKHHPIETSETE